MVAVEESGITVEMESKRRRWAQGGPGHATMRIG